MENDINAVRPEKFKSGVSSDVMYPQSKYGSTYATLCMETSIPLLTSASN